MSAHPLTSLGEKKAGREVGFGVAVLATGVNPCFMCRKELECSPDQGLWGQLSMLSSGKRQSLREKLTTTPIPAYWPFSQLHSQVVDTARAHLLWEVPLDPPLLPLDIQAKQQ